MKKWSKHPIYEKRWVVGWFQNIFRRVSVERALVSAAFITSARAKPGVIMHGPRRTSVHVNSEQKVSNQKQLGRYSYIRRITSRNERPPSEEDSTLCRASARNKVTVGVQNEGNIASLFALYTFVSFFLFLFFSFLFSFFFSRRNDLVKFSLSIWKFGKRTWSFFLFLFVIIQTGLSRSYFVETW